MTLTVERHNQYTINAGWSRIFFSKSLYISVSIIHLLAKEFPLPIKHASHIGTRKNENKSKKNIYAFDVGHPTECTIIFKLYSYTHISLKPY